MMLKGNALAIKEVGAMKLLHVKKALVLQLRWGRGFDFPDRVKVEALDETIDSYLIAAEKWESLL